MIAINSRFQAKRPGSGGRGSASAVASVVVLMASASLSDAVGAAPLRFLGGLTGLAGFAGLPSGPRAGSKPWPRMRAR
jgi:hypothetical protein